jgi:hypothetical protein
MAVRITKRPIIATALVTVSLLMGAALVPVAAQQSGLDGQVALRSDGSVYLITGGQRRWVATVQITDAEINAYPEAEPIYTGLAPIGGQEPAAAASPVAGASPVTGTAAAPRPAAPPAAPLASGATAPAGTGAQVDPSLPVEIDIDGAEKFEPGDVINLEVKTSIGATCELTARFPDGSEAAQPGTAADARGHCDFSVNIPANAPIGAGLLRGTARLNGLTNTGELPFEVVPAQ